MYNSKVLLGNWYEELEIQKEKTVEFIKKRDNRELVIQKIRSLFCNVCRKTQLSKTEDYIKFGNQIQLFSPDTPGFKENGNSGVIVSIALPRSAIGKLERFGDQMPVVCAAKSEPYIRNTFTIKSADFCNRIEENLLYGQNFILQLTDSPEEDLYLRSVTPLVDDTRGPKEHNRILLSNIKDCYCMWKVLYLDKNLRFETEGAPFSSNTRVVIAHVMTGECLAVESLDWESSIFGIECGISVHTYKDVTRRETSECHWMFLTDELPPETITKNVNKFHDQI